MIDELARRHALTFQSAPAEALIARLRMGGEDGWLAKPLTFMNLSGRAVGALTRYYRVEAGDLLVVADDVYLPLGRLRGRARGSAGGHNGLQSIVDGLATDAFARLRIGVGGGEARRDLADHVLARFDADERPIIEAAVLRAADAVETFMTAGLERMMNLYNRDDQENREETGTE